MWIQSSLLPLLGEEGMEAVQIQWRFDEFNSSSLISSFDRNTDGYLSSQEIEAARLESFNHLLADEYYLIVDVNGFGVHHWEPRISKQKSPMVNSFIHFESLSKSRFDGRIWITLESSYLTQATLSISEAKKLMISLLNGRTGQ